jgi:twitching motility protein PilU
LCLSTLHANNSYNALNRIINFFPRELREALLSDLSLALRAVISQRLVRTVEGRRVPAVEILLNTKHISDLIRSGEIGEIKEAMEQSLAPGSQTFEQALFHLYTSGRVSLEEALANSDSPTNLHWLINNAAKTPEANAEPTDDAGQPGGTRTNDISSIKLNLDALG